MAMEHTGVGGHSLSLSYRAGIMGKGREHMCLVRKLGYQCSSINTTPPFQTKIKRDWRYHETKARYK